MNKTALKKFQKLFENKQSMIFNKHKVLVEEFNVCDDDKYDEADQAATDTEQNMGLRLRNREALLLKKIQEALTRIEEGTFGECHECGEDIELRRLEARPEATLCIACKEEEERLEGSTVIGRSHKSLGSTFTTRRLV